MTRREQIEEQADNYRDEDFKNNPNGYTVSTYCNSETTSEAFIQGAEWADSNPRTDEPFIDMNSHRIVLRKVKSLEEKLQIAIEALKYIGNSIPGPNQEFEIENKKVAQKSLSKIDTIKENEEKNS